MPVAIVLSGGGAQGDFEVGALRYNPRPGAQEALAKLDCCAR